MSDIQTAAAPVAPPLPAPKLADIAGDLVRRRSEETREKPVPAD